LGESLLVIAATLLSPLSAHAQETPTRVTVREVEPRLADVATIDGIVAAYYEVVSGPVGQQRDWSRDRTLYLEPILFTIARVDSGGKPFAHTIPWQTYVDESDAYLVESGFTEREIHRETREFGNIAHVWSTYEWTTADGGMGRGINGLHLFHDGSRWWITHATWDNERASDPIPDEYLP